MYGRIRTIFAAVVAVALLEATASAGLIFDNSAPGPRGTTVTSLPQLGGEVTAAAGTSRVVTELDLGFTSQGLAITADIQAFLYANDGADGAPGTLLWSSAVMTGVNFNSMNDLLSFSVPSIVVPDTFTFASAITNATGVLGYVPASGASTGTFDQAYVGSPGSWSPLSSAFETEARVFTLDAVPEPSSLALVGTAVPFLVGCVLFRRRRDA